MNRKIDPHLLDPVSLPPRPDLEAEQATGPVEDFDLDLDDAPSDYDDWHPVHDARVDPR